MYLVDVSFDHHFDSTTRGRKTPNQVLADLVVDDVSPESQVEDPPSDTEN
jgi:hypothetical protein